MSEQHVTDSPEARPGVGCSDWLECQDCDTKKPDVKERDCPYALEIYDEHKRVVICDNCSHERYLDT